MGNHSGSSERWGIYLNAIAQGKTTTELAEASGVPRTTIVRQRNGETTPTPAHAAALALACDHPVLEAFVAAQLLDLEHAAPGLDVESVAYLGQLFGQATAIPAPRTRSAHRARAPRPRR